MFKRLKEKISEEVKQSPLLQDDVRPKTWSEAAETAKLEASGKNLIDLQDGSSAMLDFSGSEGFSIGDVDDSIPSETTSPTSPVASFENVDLSDNIITSMSPASGHSRRRLSSGDSASNFLPIYSPSSFDYSIQSDLESQSEVDDSVVNLEVISKDQLYQAFQKAKSRYVKYKTRYGNVVKAYKDQLHETDKIKSILTESQDKALRRISEMKEQSQLDKKAKQHLEENFLETLEEKEELVRVLQTQVRLLKSGVNPVETDIPEKSISNDGKSADGESADVNLSKKLVLQEDTINKLKNLLKNCKETITKQRASLAEAEAESIARTASFAEELRRAAEKADLLESKEEDRAVQMAESKRLMHEELEVRDENERRLKEQLQKLVAERAELQTQLCEKSGFILELQAASTSDKSTVDTELQMSLQQEVEALRVNKFNLESDVARLSEEMQILNVKIENEIQRSVKLNEDLMSKNELIEEGFQREQCLSVNISDLKATLNTLNERVSMIDDLRTELQMTRNNSEQGEVEHSKHIQRLESELESEKKEVLQAKSLCENLHDEMTNFKESSVSRYEFDELNKKYEELSVNFASISSDKIMPESKSNQNEPISSLASQMETVTKVTAVDLRLQLTEIKETMSDAIMELDSKNTSVSQAFDSLVSINRNLEDRFNSVSSQYDSAKLEIEVNRQELIQMKQRLEISENVIEEMNKNSENDILNKTLEIENLMQKLSLKEAELETEFNATRIHNERTGHEIESLKTAKDILGREVIEFKFANEKLVQEIDSLKKRIQVSEEHVVQLQTQQEGSVQEVNLLTEKNRSVYGKLVEMDAHNKTLIEETVELKHQKELLVQEVYCTKDKTRVAEEEIQSLLSEKIILKDALKTGQQNSVVELDSLRMKDDMISNLEFELDSLKNKNVIIEEQVQALLSEKMLLEVALKEEKENLVAELDSLRKKDDMISNLQLEMDSMTDRHRIIEEKFQFLNIEKMSLEDALNAVKENSIADFDTLRKKDDTISNLELELDTLKNKNMVIKEQFQTVSNEKIVLEEALNAEKARSIMDLDILRKKEDIISNLGVELESLNNKNKIIEQQVQELSKDRKVLEVTLNEEKENSSRKNGLEFEIELLRSQNIDLHESHKTELDKLQLEHKDKLNELNQKFKTKLKNLTSKQSTMQSTFQEEKAKWEASSKVLTTQMVELESQLNGQESNLLIEMDTLKLSLDHLKSTETELKSLINSNEEIILQLNEKIVQLETERNRLEIIEKNFETKLINLNEEHSLLIQRLKDRYEETLNAVQKKSEEDLQEQYKMEDLKRSLVTKEDFIRQLQDEIRASGSVFSQEKSTFEDKISKLELNLKDSSDERRVELDQFKADYDLKFKEFLSEKECLLAEISKKNDQIDESLLLAQENEMHSSKIKEDVEIELERSREEIISQRAEFEQRFQSMSDEHSDELRRLTRHYEEIIALRDEEAARQLAAAIEESQNSDNRMRRDHAKQVRDIGIEFSKKSETLESDFELSIEKNKTLETELKSLVVSHQQQLQKADTKWKSLLEKKSRDLELRHREELDGLYQEWQIEKKVPFNSDVLVNEELRKEANLATLVLESGDQSSELLRRQIMAMQAEMENLKDRHRNEILQLKEAMKTNNCPIPLFVVDPNVKSQRLESLEIEYLKNILFEYMMGRERQTMAKVISAVVRFSAEQTSKVLEREESRGVGGQIADLLK